jgi:hypothetical protein
MKPTCTVVNQETTSMSKAKLVTLTSAAVLLGSVASYPAAAEILVLRCTEHVTFADGSSVDYDSRVEITPETLGYVAYHSNSGGAERLAGRGTLQKLEPDKVTFRDSPGKVGWINRTTGEAYFKDMRTGEEGRGTCKESS